MDGERRAERSTELDRIVFFSDAVFAIAVTLLMLDIRLPDGLSSTELTAALGEMWPRFMSYVISFSLISGYWRAHHTIFRYVTAYDSGLITLNLLFLMSVAFLPFSSSLLGEYGSQRIAVEIYAGSVAVTGILLAALWAYATWDRRLTSGTLDPLVIRQIMTERVSPPIIALIIVVITVLFGVTAALYALVPLLLLQFAVERILPRLRGQSQRRRGARTH